jgi:23S rRNA (guanine2445-N2)-methyltransferase / 23S rRNA (guanine2069-N7)-methyltransferase
MEASEPREFAVTFAAGLEPLARAEIETLGGHQVSESAGALAFEGTLETGYRLCLWSRFASRILLTVASTARATDGAALHDASFGIDWEDHFGAGETFAVSCTGRASGISNTHYGALCVKDGIADRFNRISGKRPSVDLKDPDIRIHVFLDEDRATFRLDLSGEALHRRGYRISGGEAPLKESLAAAISAMARACCKEREPSSIVDPMCGSGTLLIEAALLWGDVAPGLLRRTYGFTKWRGHDPRLWDRLLLEARERRERGLRGPVPHISGYDASRTSVVHARQHIERAQLSAIVHVEQREIAFLTRHWEGVGSEAPMGLVLVNPPYGERLAEPENLPYLYRCLGRKLREAFAGWTAGVFTANEAPSDALGMEPVARHALMNGPIPCALQIFHVPKTIPKAPAHQVVSSPLPGTGLRDEFADRLRKNLKARGKWTRAESVTCFRAYDADLPQYNAAIDFYEGRVRIQEYKAPASVPRESAAAHLRHMVAVVQEVFGVGRNRLFVVSATSQRRQSSALRGKSEREILHEVGEGGCRFLVGLSDPRGTGLPLEQRTLRRLIAEAAPGKSFLNLFCGSAAATIHAAMAGARASVSVDDSPSRIQRARKNLLLNGLSEENHCLVVAEPVQWLHGTKGRFDLVFADATDLVHPGGRRESSGAGKDPTSFVRACVNRVEKAGAMILTTRDRRFTMDESALRGLYIQEISRITLPPDFGRTPRIQRSWRIVRR